MGQKWKIFFTKLLTWVKQKEIAFYNNKREYAELHVFRRH